MMRKRTSKARRSAWTPGAPAKLRKIERVVTKSVKASIQRDNEKKYVTTSIAPTINNVTWGPIDLVPTLQGLGVNDRIGDKITPVSLKVRGFITQALNASTVPTQIRMVLFRWLDNTLNNTPLSASTQVFELALASAFKSQFSVANRDSFEVLYDKTYTLIGAGTAQCDAKDITFGKKLASKKIVFNPGFSSGSNKIYLVFVTDTSITTGISASCVFKFTDD